LHAINIGKTWWLLAGGIWGFFWGVDAFIEKYDPGGIKATWDADTTHLPSHWQTWLVVLLVILMFALIEGSYRHFHKNELHDQNIVKAIRKELNEEIAKNAKPNITGRIINSVVIMVGEHTESEVTTPSCTIALKLSITGRNNVDTTLKDASIALDVDGRGYSAQRWATTQLGIFQGSDGSKTVSEKMIDLISAVTYSNPVRYRLASEGWLGFHIEGLEADRGSAVKANVVVTLIDELGDGHIVTGDNVIFRS